MATAGGTPPVPAPSPVPPAVAALKAMQSAEADPKLSAPTLAVAFGFKREDPKDARKLPEIGFTRAGAATRVSTGVGGGLIGPSLPASRSGAPRSALRTIVSRPRVGVGAFTLGEAARELAGQRTMVRVMPAILFRRSSLGAHQSLPFSFQAQFLYGPEFGGPNTTASSSSSSTRPRSGSGGSVDEASADSSKPLIIRPTSIPFQLYGCANPMEAAASPQHKAAAAIKKPAAPIVTAPTATAASSSSAAASAAPSKPAAAALPPGAFTAKPAESLSSDFLDFL
jgi:hypothetical protein